MYIKILLIFAIFVPAVLAGCTPAIRKETPKSSPREPTFTTETTPSDLTPTNSSPPENESRPLPSETIFGLTYQSLTGNRLIPGKGNLPFQAPLEVELPGRPVWIVGVPENSGSYWTVVLENGKLLSFLVRDNRVEQIESIPEMLPPGMPPAVIFSPDGYSYLSSLDQQQSTTTHPIYLPESKLNAHINDQGQLVFTDTEGLIVTTLKANALPDARLLIDEQERLLLLSDPTDRYSHGVLGDELEAGSITLVETHPTIHIASVIRLAENEVVEGIAPIWVDVTGNSQKEIIVTVSDVELGAGIEVFSESGERLAAGPKMGQPYRWRHQIAYGPFGPGGEKELTVVRTPHIGGTIEYYQLKGSQLEIAAEYPGITSHILGSRNLDMAAGGDFDGDGALELLMPNPQLTELVAVRRSKDSAEEVWRLPIEGVLSTNLAAVSLSNGMLALGIGTESGVFKLWLP